jgi:hypothetical protein
MNPLDRLLEWWRGFQDPFDWDYPDSEPGFRDSDMDCPDTMPTSPGALDSDLGRLD